MFPSRKRGVLRSIGKNYMYRQSPSDVGYNSSAEPVTTTTTSSATLPPQTIIKVRLLVCLYDDSNAEHVESIRPFVRPDVEYLPLNMSTPIYNLQAEVKMTLWRLLNSTSYPSTVVKRLSHVGFIVYPLLSFDELECFINNIIPTVRAYFSFTSGQTMMPCTIFTILPTDATFMAKLAVVNETLKIAPLAICLSSQECSSICSQCSEISSNARNQFFLSGTTFDMLVNLANIVEQLERKLICLGNLKGLMVSNKMQNIFNRMLYIEDRYRKLQGNIMTETCYDGMLSEIEHIESKIRDVSMQIPLSYTEGYELINKLTDTTNMPPQTSCSNACRDTSNPSVPAQSAGPALESTDIITAASLSAESRGTN